MLSDGLEAVSLRLQLRDTASAASRLKESALLFTSVPDRNVTDVPGHTHSVPEDEWQRELRFALT